MAGLPGLRPVLTRWSLAGLARPPARQAVSPSPTAMTQAPCLTARTPPERFVGLFCRPRHWAPCTTGISGSTMRYHSTTSDSKPTESNPTPAASDARTESPAEARPITPEKPSASTSPGATTNTVAAPDVASATKTEATSLTDKGKPSSSPHSLDPALEEALTREEEIIDDDGDNDDMEADDEDETSSGAESGGASRGERYVTDHQRQLQYEKKLKQVERLMDLQEVMSKDGLQKCLKFTNVSTMAGVHWQDVSPTQSLRSRPGFQKQPEGFFAHTVLAAIFGKNLAPELSAFVMDGNPLPHVVADEDWWGLTLRVSHEGAAAVQLSSLVDLPDDTSLRESELARVRNLEAVYGIPSLSSSPDDEVDTYASQLFGTAPTQSGTKRETTYDEVTNKFSTKASHQTRWARFKTFLSAQSWARAEDKKATATKKKARNGTRRPRSGQSTLQHFSSKLTIIVVREPHPLEATIAPPPPTPTSTPTNGAAQTPTVMSLKTTMTPDASEDEEPLWEQTERARAARQRARQPYDPNNPNADLGDGMEGEAKAPSPSTTDTTSAESPKPPRTPLTRFRVVSIHHQPIPFLDAAFTNWPALATSKLVAPLGVPAVDTVQDVVRLMIRGAVASFQEDAYRATRQMESIENLIYEVDGNVNAQRQTVAHTMAHLHVMSRRARAQEMILRDTQMTAVRLRALTPGKETNRDVQDQAFMSRSISLATHVEEHTESLLFLQFQVVSNEMAENLRTLTIFSTFFIPLNFFLNVFNMRFDGLLAWCHQENSIYVFAALLFLTTFGMGRFAQRYLPT